MSATHTPAPASAESAPRRLPWQGSFFLLAAMWGCSFWWIKVGLRAVTFVDVALLRLAFGAASLLAISAVTRTALPRRPATWAHLFVAGVLFCSAPFTLISYGETRISAVLTGIINALTPLMAVLASTAVFGDRTVSRRLLVGLGMGFGGVLVVLGVWDGLGKGHASGIAAVLGATVCYGLGFTYSSRFLASAAGGESPVALATGQVLSGTVQILPFALLLGRVHSNPPATSFIALAALGILGTGVGYVLNFDVIGHAPPAIASSVTYVVPIFAVIVGAVFLSETVHWYEPIGAALILLGAAITQDRLRGLRRLRRRSGGAARLASSPAEMQRAGRLG
jgi:drug/metabolite transporter (DMT)-like permease